MKIARSHIVLASLFLLLFTALAGILFIDSVGAENNKTESGSEILIKDFKAQSGKALFLLTENSEAREINFPKIKADFPINGLGLKWIGDFCSYHIKTEKTGWLSVNKMSGENIQKNKYNFSEPFFIEGQNIEVQGTCSNVPEYLEVIYFDSKPSHIFTTFKTQDIVQNSSDLKIISRAEWQADESLRFWEPQYAQPKAFIIHHTAGGTGKDDPAATVRGIYYWHAVVMGWGDIGYNYLVDSAGNIYEGRYGGDMVVGAHAYNDTEGVNYNEGTIGISVLGCFESDEPGCNTVNEFTEETKKSLENLISVKAKKNSIKIAGERLLFNKKIKGIVGHQDVDYTLCPGNIIEDSMPEMRAAVKEKIGETAIKIINPDQALLMSNNIPVAVMENWKPKLKMVYKNNGQIAWEPKKTVLFLNGRVVAKLKKKKILSGEEAVFKFSLSTRRLSLGNNTLKFYLKNNHRRIGNSLYIRMLRIDE